MFGVGWTEMLVIGVVALVVIGPKDLPVVMNRIGKALGVIRRMGNEFQREINRTTGLDQITDIRRTFTEPLRQTAEEITRQFNQTGPNGTVTPTGLMQPTEPGAESVVDEIHARVGMTPPADTVPTTSAPPPPVSQSDSLGPLMTSTPSVPAPTPAVESPAPPEAVAPKKPRAPRRKPLVSDETGVAVGTPLDTDPGAAPKRVTRRRPPAATTPEAMPIDAAAPSLFPVDPALSPAPSDATPVTTPAARTRKPRTPKPTLES